MFDMEIGMLWFYVAIFAGVGGLIGWRKKQVVSGIVWGGLLGPVGWLVTLLLPSRGPKCPLCGGALANEIVPKCRHCGSDIDPEVFGTKKKSGPSGAGMRPPGKRLR